MQTSCQDRLAELQAELARIPSALELANSSWKDRKPALRRRAAQAVRRIASHVLGKDKLAKGATSDEARRAFEGALSARLEAPENSKVALDSDSADSADSAEPTPEQAAANWCFWICEELDDEFAAWAAGYSRKAELAELAARSPRVRLGLAPKVAGALPMGVELGEPLRIAGYLVPTALAQSHTNTDKDPESHWIRLKAVKRFVPLRDQDPSRDPAGAVPRFRCKLAAEGLSLWFDELEEFKPEATLVLETEEPDFKCSNTQSTAEVAQAVVDIVKELPPIPRYPKASDPLGLFRRLAEIKLGKASSKAKREKAGRLLERVEALAKAWTLCPSALPTPQVEFNEPETAWVSTLEVLAEGCSPSLDFPKTVFENVCPLAEPIQPPEENPEDLKQHRKNRAWELEALHSTWGLLNHALRASGFTEASFSDFKLGNQAVTAPLEGFEDTDPLRAHSAWVNWQHALWRGFLESPDDLVPATLNALDWLTAGCKGLQSALRWSAEAATWAGLPAQSQPDGMWCTFHGIPLVLTKFKRLPESP